MEKQGKINNTKQSVYIHIPFCEHICEYCDFNKVFLEGQPVDEYIDLLLREIDLTVKKIPNTGIKTIYIGGGTPTSLNVKQMEHLLKGVNSLLSLAERSEFTIEVNPGDLTQEKLLLMQEFGVNRLSLGVQTLKDDLLRKIGRHHTVQDIFQTLDMLKREDFKNVSIDLIYALPDQTRQDWEKTLDLALSFDLPHYSLYSLILENHTMFMNRVRCGQLILPSEDRQADLFEVALERMEQYDLEHYEISNFAKDGFQSQHNLVYWNNENYFGFGAGASGYVGDVRYKNHGPIQHYLNSLRNFELPVVTRKSLSIKNQIEEEMFLGLRKLQGVSKRIFFEKFGVNFSEIYGEIAANLVEKELLFEDDKKVSLSEKGLLLGNFVFEKFLL
ncbi:MAG: radical SAM family heme chaperone HemW [Lactobacillales bacterium]|jgi:oxygen-independent coproporphyrinogen-3 oxidase|nr:radical SAM family heme chaperone HemW [Lactobacillales bacterium]